LYVRLSSLTRRPTIGTGGRDRQKSQAGKPDVLLRLDGNRPALDDSRPANLRSLHNMTTAMRFCQISSWSAPLVLATLMAGCMGHSGLVFPWSQAQDIHESAIEHVTTATFEERVLKCEKTVLVDFYGESCEPCKKLGPVLEDFAKEHPETRVVKVNVEENHELAGRYGVQRIPCLLVFRNKQVLSRSMGLITKEKMLKMTLAPL
jgi:thioredoxin 1